MFFLIPTVIVALIAFRPYDHHVAMGIGHSQMGVCRGDGSWIVEPGDYKSFKTFSQSDATDAGFLRGTTRDGKVGIVRCSDGVWVIPPLYKDILTPGTKAAMCKQNRRWGVVSFDGKPQTEFIFTSAENAGDASGDSVGAWIATLADGSKKVVTEDGTVSDASSFVSTAPKVTNAADRSEPAVHKTVCVKKGGKWGLAGPDGAIILPCDYDEAEAVGPGDVDAYVLKKHGWTLDSIRGVVDKDYPALVWRTVWVSVASAAICILLSIPMAYTMARASQRMRSAMLMLTIIPFWTSFIIRIFAWMQVLHTDGFLKHALVWLRLIPKDGTLMYNMGAVLLVMVYTSLPFAILPLYAAAEKFDFSLMDAAQDLGASRFRSVIATFLPGIRSGILYATLMVLVPNLGCYITSEVVGGTDCMLMGNRIKECAIDFRDLPHACALALFLMLGVFLALLILYLVVRIRGGREAVAEMAKSAAESVA